MEEDFKIETSNINFKWLDYIYEQLKKIQEMQVIAKEGCTSLVEYLQVPIEIRIMVVPELQYKNLRFMINEIDMLVDNIYPILKEDTKQFKEKLKTIKKVVNQRELFLKDYKKNGNIYKIDIQELFFITLDYLIDIKSDIIKKISPILYIENKEKSKTW